MIKAFYAVIVSAIAAGCFVAFPILSQQVRANPPTLAHEPASIEPPAAVGACSENTWPYLDATCLRNAGGLVLAPREVRLVSEDRHASVNGR